MKESRKFQSSKYHLLCGVSNNIEHMVHIENISEVITHWFRRSLFYFTSARSQRGFTPCYHLCKSSAGIHPKPKIDFLVIWSCMARNKSFSNNFSDSLKRTWKPLSLRGRKRLAGWRPVQVGILWPHATETKRTNHLVYDTKCHLVWAPKCRR